MTHSTSAYIYEVKDGHRTFHHFWKANGKKYDCSKCRSTVADTEPYSNHWPQNTTQNLIISEEQKNQLQIIDENKIETFFLCNKNIQCQRKQFILDAGMEAIPQLLRLMFYEVDELKIKISFYVRKNKVDLLFKSSELMVLNHYDVYESVDAVFCALLEKISTYFVNSENKKCCIGHENDYQVQRMTIDIQRIKANCNSSRANENGPIVRHTATVPLKYRIRNTLIGIDYEQQHCQDEFEQQRHAILPHSSISTAYMQLLKDPNAVRESAEKFNLYCFQECRDSLELFAVPYHYSDSSKQSQNFIIINDVTGKFRQLKKIANIRRFLRPPTTDQVMTCNVCQANFTRKTSFMLHRMLKCGRAFEILKLPSNSLEIYEKCLPMQCEAYEWPLYGIFKKQKTEKNLNNI